MKGHSVQKGEQGSLPAGFKSDFHVILYEVYFFSANEDIVKNN